MSDLVRPLHATQVFGLGVCGRYVAALNAWFEVQEEEGRITAHYETASLDTRARLEERVTRADDIRKAFRTFQLEVSGWLCVQRERRGSDASSGVARSGLGGNLRFRGCAVTAGLYLQTPKACACRGQRMGSPLYRA